MRFQGYLEDIIREYSLMVDMKGHSNVVYCDDFRYVQHEDGIGWDIYIKMEMLTPLTKALGKEIDERQVMDLGIDICSALVMCRERNIVHRDIKPQNIFVSKDGTYKLGDFGIAKTAERTTSGTKIGTYKYMAPEVYNNQPYGAGADIYSLGLLMYWMLNERRTPFLPLPPQVPSSSMEDEARNRRFLGEEIPAPAHGSEELKQIVLKACAYDPKERYASAADMRDALLRLRDGAAVVIPPVPVPDEEAGAGETEVPVVPVGDAAEENAESDRAQDTSESTCGDAGAVPIITPADADENGGAPESTAAPESDTTPETAAEEAKEEKKRKPILWIVLAAVLALCVGIGAFAMGGDGDTKTPALQVEWTEWGDALPDGVTETDYEIEEQILYRSRELEKTTSANNVLDGWEQYDSVTSGEFSAWSAWSTASVSAGSTREVQVKTQYRSRSVTTETKYSDWSSTQTTTSKPVESETLRITATKQTKWGYQHWCNYYDGYWNIDSIAYGTNCAQHFFTGTSMLPAYNMADQGGQQAYGGAGTGAGGCGYGYYVWFRYPANDQYSYSYQTRTGEQVKNHGTWSSWSDTAVSASDTVEVETQTVYRYRDKSTETTYYFRRWSDWSDYSENAVSPSDSVEVETLTQYRYRSKQS